MKPNSWKKFRWIYAWYFSGERSIYFMQYTKSRKDDNFFKLAKMALWISIKFVPESLWMPNFYPRYCHQKY